MIAAPLFSYWMSSVVWTAAVCACFSLVILEVLLSISWVLSSYLMSNSTFTALCCCNTGVIIWATYDLVHDLAALSFIMSSIHIWTNTDICKSETDLNSRQQTTLQAKMDLDRSNNIVISNLSGSRPLARGHQRYISISYWHLARCWL